MRKKKHKNILFYRKAVQTSVIFDDSGRGLRPIKTKAEQQAECERKSTKTFCFIEKQCEPPSSSMTPVAGCAL